MMETASSIRGYPVRMAQCLDILRDAEASTRIAGPAGRPQEAAFCAVRAHIARLRLRILEGQDTAECLSDDIISALPSHAAVILIVLRARLSAMNCAP